MTEEIKEISDLQRCADNNKSHLLLDFEIKNILRYITNLQKDYERIYNENCKLREQHNINDISLLDELQDYKSRNEKAVGLLKNMTFYYPSQEGEALIHDLLNILQGGDE